MRIPHTNAFADLVQKLLMKDPRDRLGGSDSGADDILAHEWFEDISKEDLLSKSLEPVAPESFFRQAKSLKYFNTRTGSIGSKVLHLSTVTKE